MSLSEEKRAELLAEIERIERRWAGAFAPDAVIRRIDQIVEELGGNE